MAKIKVTNNQPEPEKPLHIKVNKAPERKLKISNLPNELKVKPEPPDDKMRLKITNKGTTKKLVIQFRKKNGQLQAKQADGKQWVKITNKQVAKLKGKVKVTGYDPFQAAVNAVAKQGPKGDPGEDGQSVELRKSKNWIEWKQENDKSWKKLVSLNDLKGEPGKDGVTTIIGGGGGTGGGTTGINSVVAGDNVVVDNTDPSNPIVSVTIPPDAGVMTIAAGDHISVDSSNPATPIITAEGFVEAVVAGDFITIDDTDPENPIINSTPPSVYLLTGMFTSENADVSGYEYATPLPEFTAGVEVSASATVTTTPTVLQEFISRVGRPGITLIVAGVAILSYDTEKTAGTANYYSYAEVYKRSAGGVETLLFTTENSTTTASNMRQSVQVNAYNAVDIPLLITDRIVVKVYAVMLTASATISVYYDGNSNSRIQYPTAVADSSAFVRKFGDVAETVTGVKTFEDGINIGVNTWGFQVDGKIIANQIEMNNNPSGNAYISSWDSNIAIGGGSSDVSLGSYYTMIIWQKGVSLWSDPYSTVTGMHVGMFSGSPGTFWVSSVATNFRRYGIIGNADGSNISGLAFGSTSNNGATFTEQMQLTMDAVGAANSVLDMKSITNIIGIVPDVYDATWEDNYSAPSKADLWVVLGDIEAALDAILGA